MPSLNKQILTLTTELNQVRGLPLAQMIETHQLEGPNGGFTARRSFQIGHICAERSGLGWQIQQIVNAGGAVIDIGPEPRMKTREVVLVLKAMLTTARDILRNSGGADHRWQDGNA